MSAARDISQLHDDNLGERGETYAVSTSWGNSLMTFLCPNVCFNFSISCWTFCVDWDLRVLSSALSEEMRSFGDIDSREAEESDVDEESASPAEIFFRREFRASDSWDFSFSSSLATRWAMCSSRDFARVEFVYSWKNTGMSDGTWGLLWETYFWRRL